jgi:hypothetical protein
VIQYRACKELSTWWQRAGRAGQSLSVNAIAILLVEPCFFDDEKEKLLKKAAEKISKNVAAGQKRAAEGQLQSAPAKRSRNIGHMPATRATITILSDTVTVERMKIGPEMDNFINAERRPANDRRKIANTHFGNDNLGKSINIRY